MAEKRVYSRVLFAADAQLRQQNRSWSTKILDLSLNGALIERPNHYTKADSPISLSFNLPGSDIQIDIEMQLKHLDDKSMGLKCLHIDFESIGHLKRMLSLNQGDASLLDRELDYFVAEHSNKP